jgi:ketosteroid isomerase-like protein
MRSFDRSGFASALAALVVAACTAPAPPPSPTPPPTPAPLTAEQAVDLYKKCWGYVNEKNWDAFQNCYTTDAVKDMADSGQPPAQGRAGAVAAVKAGVAPYPDVHGDLQLVIHSGNRIVGVALWKGTNTAPTPLPDGKEAPATGKKFGLLIAHSAEFDAGRTAVKADVDWIETGTLAGQLGQSKAKVRPVMETGAAEPVVAIGTGTEAESANTAAVQLLFENINKRDLAAFEGQLADAYVLHEVGLPADTNKKQSIASTKELLKAFGDAKITPSEVFAAGAYVVAIGTLEGTNDGAWPAMGIPKKTGKPVKLRFLEVFRLDGGKVVEDWLFYNGPAMAGQLGLM